jgi:FAD:protein FMN transferase
MIGLAKCCVTTCLLWSSGSIVMAQALERFEFTKPLLGTVVEVTLYAPTETVATEAATATFARIAELNRILSDYNPESEVMRLCRTAGTGSKVEVSPELFEMLSRSASLSEATDGAFDVTISPVIKLWRAARKRRQLPDLQQLAAARKLVGWKNVKLDSKARTAELLRPGMQFDFGGIAKGYIAQEARDVLIKRGLTHCLIAVGGDIAAGDPPPQQDCWKIGIAPLDKPDGPPSRLLRLKNCSVSTSGDAFQFVEINGVRYSHIVDSKTGLGLTQRSSVTVIASDGATADGLATAVTILGPERGLKLIEQSKETEALIVLAGDDGPSIRESPGFAKFVIQPE